MSDTYEPKKCGLQSRVNIARANPYTGKAQPVAAPVPVPTAMKRQASGPCRPGKK